MVNKRMQSTHSTNGKNDVAQAFASADRLVEVNTVQVIINRSRYAVAYLARRQATAHHF